MKPLGEIVRIIKGSKSPEVYNKPFHRALRYIQIEDLRSDANLKFAIDQDGVLAEETDVLIAWDGANAGTTGFGLQGYVGSTIAILRPIIENIYTPYLGHFLQSKFLEIKKNTTGATIPHVSRNYLENLPVPIPSLIEQKRIADILQKADRLRHLRQYAHQLSDGYMHSMFFEMFGNLETNSKGWNIGRVEDVIKSSQYGTSKKSNDENRGYPILGMGNISFSGQLNLSNLTYVDLSKSEVQELRLEPGDIIFNRTNSTELVGKTAYWNLQQEAVLASYLIKIKLMQTVIPEFFAFLMNTYYYKNLFRKRCKKAVGQSNISPTLLREFPLFIPPLEIQQRFAVFINQHMNLEKRQIESLRQVEHLFQSLLHQAFQG